MPFIFTDKSEVEKEPLESQIELEIASSELEQAELQEKPVAEVDMELQDEIEGAEQVPMEEEMNNTEEEEALTSRLRTRSHTNSESR